MKFKNLFFKNDPANTLEAEEHKNRFEVVESLTLQLFIMHQKSVFLFIGNTNFEFIMTHLCVYGCSCLNSCLSYEVTVTLKNNQSSEWE